MTPKRKAVGSIPAGNAILQALCYPHSALFMMFSAAIKPKVHGSLRSPLQVAISDCSPLWLKTCHRHVFLTRRAHRERQKNRVEMRDFFILTHFHNNLINIKGELLSIDSRRWVTIFSYRFHILFQLCFKLVVIYYRSVPIAV